MDHRSKFDYLGTGCGEMTQSDILNRGKERKRFTWKYLRGILEPMVLGLLMSCTGNYNASNVLKLDENWKFQVGDDLSWANPAFDDSGWDTIRIESYWDYKGLEDYDGVVWYRNKFFLPSSLQEKSYLKDSLQIDLGKIDDRDQLYINGVFIGQNNTITTTAPPDSTFIIPEFYIPKRRYVIASDHPSLKWDKENVIAVRVYDQWGGGGMYSGVPYISMVDVYDKLIINSDEAAHPYRFHNNTVSKIFAFTNTSEVVLKGMVTIEAMEEIGSRPYYKMRNEMTLQPGKTEDFSIVLNAKEEANSIKVTFEHNNSGIVMEYFDEIPYVLTPEPSDLPRINGAKVIGVYPGNPFLYIIPATGTRPMLFDVEGLPKGLAIDTITGIVTGHVLERGEYNVMMKAKNNLGEHDRALKIVVGDKIALTPPLGWNSWNCWGAEVDENKVLQSAHALIDKGLINHGWTYINIDDGWQGGRDNTGQILVNDKFKDMKALADSLHSYGLKFGIYSSPGPRTCGGFTGSYQHVLKDAKSYANWGVDFLKYDWCTYGILIDDHSLPELKKPYSLMNEALKSVNRDIVFSICQYGMGNVWEWGAEVGGNLWRTTGDISDSWELIMFIGFNKHISAPFSGPGHWNDPDMMVVGWLGLGANFHPSNLTVDEQYTHVSLWSLISAPLLIGCDLNRLDDFTLNLLTNDEVLAVNQDPLGDQAIPLVNENNIQIWMKDLENGSKAVGIFNLNPSRQEVLANLTEIGITGKQIIRDIWRQQDIGVFENEFKVNVPAHGVVLINISKSD